MSNTNGHGWIVLTSGAILDLLGGVEISKTWRGSVTVRADKESAPSLAMDLYGLAGDKVQTQQLGLSAGQTSKAPEGRSVALSAHDMCTLLFFLSSEMAGRPDCTFRVKITYKEPRGPQIHVSTVLNRHPQSEIAFWGLELMDDPDDS